ncbi:aspartyl protease family protein [Ekhidna sp.]
MKKYHFLSLLFLILFGTKLCAQIATMPFEMHNSHIILKFKDATGVDRSFVFDTGAECTVFDAKLAEKIGLKPDGQVTVTGVSGRRSLGYVLNQSLFLSKEISLNNIHFILSDLLHIDQSYDGIIGYDLLQKYIVKIDYINQELAFFERVQETDIMEHKPIAFQFYNDTKIPQFNVSMTLENNEKFEGNVLFDTGAGLTMRVGKPFAEKNGLIEKIGKTVTTSGWGLNTNADHMLATIKSIEIDTFNLGSMVVEISTADSGVFSEGDYLGLVGNLISSRFDIIIDYKHMMIYLKPNEHYHNPFHFPVSGIELKEVETEIVVSSIVEESLAYQMGLRQDDRILSINESDSSNIDNLRKMLTKEGEKVKITFSKKEGESVNQIEIVLARML